jgi:oligopeptidase B
MRFLDSPVVATPSSPGLETPAPPRAPRRPTVLSEHGDERIDDWYWLRERENPDVLAYLEAENAYTDAVLARLRPLEDRIYDEIRSHVQETDVSAPVAYGPWSYYSRTYEGRSYAVHCRRPRRAAVGDADVSREQTLLDENAEAEGHDYFSLGGFEVSPEHRTLAFAVDVTGDERHTLRFRDLDASTDLDDVVENVTYGLAWAADARTCFYVRPDDAMRPWQVWRHTLGTDAAADELVFQEDDDRFYVGLTRARTGRFILVESASKTTSEASVIPTDAPHTAPRLIAPRQPGHEYTVEHHHDAAHGDRFFVVTNRDGARNFALAVCAGNETEPGQWTTIVPSRDDVRLERVDAFAEHLVLTERGDGLVRLRVMRARDLTVSHEVAFPDPVYTVWVGPNEEFDTETLRYGYTSLVAPVTDIDYGLESRESTIVKVQPIPNYDPSRYTSERRWVERPDGARVPLSLVFRKDISRDGHNPTLLYGYGSYEISIDATFRASRVSLLDRGFVFAIAHVRGGGELGRVWYEEGRLEHKQNTFDDFIACAEALVAERDTEPSRLVARGGSAGGLLMGAIANLRPDLFAAIIAEVPFVDVVTTMLDPGLPLTITEWEEWGDPRRGDAYAWMKAYSPYDNVRDQPYPAMFVTTGLNDPRVAYWEPAKWVAKLREHTTSGNVILLRTELGAGHGGPSGRYDAWRQEAAVLAFACDRVGIRE